MKSHNEIRVETDGKGQGHRFHVIYSKDGVRHEIGQLMDAISAIETGHYFATKPVVEKKLKKRIK